MLRFLYVYGTKEKMVGWLGGWGVVIKDYPEVQSSAIMKYASVY